jgi:hypothetical protein
MATCIICEKEFTKSHHSQKYCGKECWKKYRKRYEKKYRKENKEQIRNAQKKCEANNPEKYRRYKRKWDDKNRELLNEKSRKRNLTQGHKDYKREHAETYKEERNKQQRNRFKNDYMFRLDISVSFNVRHTLKSNKIDKNRRHWEDIVGWTKDNLKRRLENLFSDGMTWENYGEWEIDHIIPKAFFKFKSIDDVEFRYCWSLCNLQPLWSEDNLKKRANVPGFKRVKGEYIKI